MFLFRDNPGKIIYLCLFRELGTEVSKRLIKWRVVGSKIGKVYFLEYAEVAELLFTKHTT
jgi:hypothetical protein